MAGFLTSPAQGNSSTDEGRLQSRLADWRFRFGNTTTPQLDNETYCSPAWEKIWILAWTEYDALEQMRIEQGFQKQSWQDPFDKYRERLEHMRRNKSKSIFLTTHDWSQVPLAMILQKYLGIHVRSGSREATSALGRWRKFREVITEGSKFRATLSVSQESSYTILTHWWSSAYQDLRLSKAAIASLEAAGSSPIPMTYFFGEPYADKEAFIHGRKSVYNSMMLALFNIEFIPYGWEPYFKELSFSSVRQMRKKALQHATAQRLAYTSYMSMQGSSIYISDSYTSSMDGPCPWLDREKDLAEMPYFLWDVEQNCTKVVSELGIRPNYCCVSHTWGRWRKDAVRIPGVPWLVPQNERFDVAILPDHLLQLRPRVRYVWIDLFCIPQDGSPKADDEINRQALIFQSSVRCVAWINDVERWDNTSKALDWLGVAYLHSTTHPGIYETETLLKSLVPEVDAPSEFFTSPDDLAQKTKQYVSSLRSPSGRPPILAINSESLGEPACWFSSLWTLQEAMLCPDLSFVTRDWIPLKDRSGTSIPLDALFTFIDIVENMWHGDTPYVPFTAGPITTFSRYKISKKAIELGLGYPEGPRQLLDLRLVTRIDSVLEWPSRIGLLILANSRQSTGSRAPAIMSALGITDWYKSDIKAPNDLVLNCYPIIFVKEAAAKLGAVFYWSVAIKQRLPSHWDKFNYPDKGSMMPFSAASGWFSKVPGALPEYRHTPEDHPAVATGTIMQDGSVAMKRAGILASSKTPADPSELPMTIDFNYDASPRPQAVRFDDWVKGFPKEVVTYAISLWRDPGWQHGLILQGYRKSWFSTQRLVKVKTFVTPERTDLPPTTNVNWLVL